MMAMYLTSTCQLLNKEIDGEADWPLHPSFHPVYGSGSNLAWKKRKYSGS